MYCLVCLTVFINCLAVAVIYVNIVPMHVWCIFH